MTTAHRPPSPPYPGAYLPRPCILCHPTAHAPEAGGCASSGCKKLALACGALDALLTSLAKDRGPAALGLVLCGFGDAGLAGMALAPAQILQAIAPRPAATRWGSRIVPRNCQRRLCWAA